jgi:hypothetical protein
MLSNKINPRLLRLVIAHSYFQMLTIIMASISIFIITSCKSSTEPRTGSLTGRVLLINDSGDSNLDPADNSGITIAVYPLAVIDSTITRLNNQYPGIGVIATQRTEFDHRSNNAITTCLTQADGSFYLEGLSEGQYNIVAMKSGWGFRYIYSININNGTNVLAGDLESGAVALYPEQKISGYMSSVNLTVGNYHHLVIEDNTYILDGSSLTLNPGAIVRINPGVKLEVMGFASIHGTNDSLVTFISNDAIFSTRQSTPVAFDGIKLNANSTLANGGVEFIKVMNSVSGLAAYRAFSIRYSVLQGVNEIVSVAGSSTDLLQVSIANCIFQMDSSSPNYDISIASSSPVSFQKNIIMGSNGLACRASANIECKDNYINVSTIGLYFYDVSSVAVMYNDIIAGSNAIFNNYRVTSNISYNNVTAMDGLRYSSFGNIATANYNNLFCSHYSITYLDTSTEHQHLPAQNNWFNTIDNELIQSLILDKSDYSENDPLFPLLSYVDYTPYRTSKQSSAGIRS